MKLKLCKKCGSDDPAISFIKLIRAWRIQCLVCGFWIVMPAKSKVIDEWNRRADGKEGA